MPTINEARSIEATKRFFHFQTDEPATDAPAATQMTRDEWESLSPGMRRAITREFEPQPAPAPRKTLRERKAAVEYAGRKRL